MIRTSPKSNRMENWAEGTSIRTEVGITRRVAGSRRWPLAVETARSRPWASYTCCSKIHPRPASMIVLFVVGPLGVSPRGTDFQAVAGQGERALIGEARIEFRGPQRLHQPVRLDGQPGPRRASGELVVATEVNGRLLIAANPEPKQFVIAAQVEFRPGDARPRAEPQSPGTLEGKARPQSRLARRTEHRLVRHEGVDLRVVAIDGLDHLHDRRRRGQHPRLGRRRTAEPSRATRSNRPRKSPSLPRVRRATGSFGGSFPSCDYSLFQNWVPCPRLPWA